MPWGTTRGARILFRSHSSGTLNFLVIKQILKVKFWASLVAQIAGKECACNVGDLGFILGLGRSPGEGKDYPLWYSAWRTPWTEEPGRLQSMGHKEGEIYLYVILPFLLGKCLILQGEEERFLSSIDCFWQFYCRRIPVLSENRCYHFLYRH